MSLSSYDVVVIGGGNAALCAALSAREQGARVLVLERAPRERRGGNSAFTGGAFRMVCRGIEDIKAIVPDLTEEQIACTDFEDYTAERFLDDLGRTTEYRADRDLAEILVRSSTDTVRWIQTQGIRFLPKYGSGAMKQNGRFKFFGGIAVEASGGGQGLVDAEFNAAERKGIVIRYRARARSLVHGRTGVEGVRINGEAGEDEIRAKAVVLACGGFEANREWRTRYLGPNWDLAKVRGSRYNTGDGLKMALEIGAQPYGNWSGAHADPWDLNAPEYGDLTVGSIFQKHKYTLGIMLNRNGLRFVDEAADLFVYTYAKYGRIILEQPGQVAWQLFDAKVLHLLDSRYRIKQAAKVTAQSLKELVAKLENVDNEQALRTITEYNAAVDRKVPFNPVVKDGRRTHGLIIPKSNWANTIDTPPFEAYAATCGITFTFGGLKIDTDAHVLDQEDKVIPGLYAAGELVGGIFYFNYPGAAGLMSGAVFGRLAGRSAARYALQCC